MTTAMTSQWYADTSRKQGTQLTGDTKKRAKNAENYENPEKAARR